MHYIAEQWRDILVFNQLDNHQKIWDLKADWFEEPNQRRGGWSGVSRIELNLPDGNKVGVFLKRQEDHISKSIAHPIKGFPTFIREYKNIIAFHENKVPSLELILFENWSEGGHQRAILMTKELEDYLPLSSGEYQPGGIYASTKQQKLVIFRKLADLMQTMHKNNFQHNCFYLKHIFAKRLADDNVELRVIDLEKVKRPFIKKRTAFRDLYTLQRHAQNWGVKDQLKFFKLYRKEKRLSNNSKNLWREIASKIKRKSNK